MTNEEAIKELKEDRALYEGDIVEAGDGTPDGQLMLLPSIWRLKPSKSRYQRSLKGLKAPYSGKKDITTNARHAEALM